jgi:hypothetical protein
LLSHFIADSSYNPAEGKILLRDAFLKYIVKLESSGIAHPDFQKERQLLKEKICISLHEN